MSRSLSTIKAQLFSLAKERGICDPLMGCYPLSERALSGLLCLYAQRNCVRWDTVPLYDVESFEEKARASSLIGQGAFLTEYVLLHRDRSEECIWGGMPADLLYVNEQSTRVVMLENKIGGDIAYEPTAESNQLARQLDYLIGLRTRSGCEVALLLASPRPLLKQNWYRREFAGALELNGRSAHAPGYLVTWEDLLNAMAA